MIDHWHNQAKIKQGQNMKVILDAVTLFAFIELVAVIVVLAVVLHWHFWSMRFAEKCLKAYERRSNDGGEWPVERRI